MNTTELVQRVRDVSFIETNSTDYTAFRIIRELADVQRQTFGDMIMKSKGGYWLRFDPYTTTVGQPLYRAPSRACAGVIHRIDIAYDATEKYVPLPEVDEEQALDWERGIGQTGVPQRYLLRGETIKLLPSPDAVYKLRVYYYLTPPTLVNIVVTNMGAITSVNPSTRVIVMSVAPNRVDEQTGNGFSITAGGRVDIVRTTGWGDTIVMSEVVSNVAGTTFTLGGTSDLSLVAVGDNMMSEGQSFWPCISVEYHRALADLTAAEICRQRRQFAAQERIEANLGGALLRFKNHIQPRAQQNARVINYQNPYGFGG